MPSETVQEISTLEYWRDEGPCPQGDTFVRRTGYNTRKWLDPEHRLKPKGRLALISNQTPRGVQYTITAENNVFSSPYSKVKTCYIDGMRMWHQRYITTVTEAAPYHATYMDPSWALDMRTKIQDAYTNLGVNLAEYRQTSRMFQQFGRAVKRGWGLYRGKISRRKPITPCTVAASHLVNTYGIQPLASDLFESVEVLRGRLAMPIVRRVTAYASDTEAFDDESSTLRQKEFHKTSKSAIGYVWLDPNHRQFTLGNPAYLAWELIPYSFVVDWAIPIGDWLMSLDALFGVKKIEGVVTTKSVITCHRYSKVMAVDTRKVYQSGPALYKSTKISRGTFNSIPIPPLPRWSPSTSYKAVANGIALLTAVNKKCK